MHSRALGRWLAEPRARTVVGVVFAFALSWHFLFGGSHIDSMVTIYGTWAAAVLCLFVMSRADDDASAPGEEAGESQDATEGSDV